jgi:hypothetical protein
VTAHPYLKGEQLKDIKGKKGYPVGQEMMSERHRRNDETGYLLVAASRLRQATGEDHLLHEGWRSDLQCRLLQGLRGEAPSGCSKSVSYP